MEPGRDPDFSTPSVETGASNRYIGHDSKDFRNALTNIQGRDLVTVWSTYASTALRVRTGEILSFYDTLPWLSEETDIRLLHPDQGMAVGSA